jgi:hypothetical protein
MKLKEGNLKRSGKNGQVTIFVILGIIIVVVAVALYLLVPGIRTSITGGGESPQRYLEDCISESIEEDVEILGLQGGTFTPANYVMYENSQVEYLCYTNKYFLPCIMQKPVLKQSIETQLENKVGNKVNECVNELDSVFGGEGYSVRIDRTKVSENEGEVFVELLPGAVVVNLNMIISLSHPEKGNINLRGYQIREKNMLYDFVMIATSILNWETRYGDSDSTTYMTYYPDIKVEKITRTDGTRVYVLTNRDDENNKFQFASRSIVLPPGYLGE